MPHVLRGAHAAGKKKRSVRAAAAGVRRACSSPSSCPMHPSLHVLLLFSPRPSFPSAPPRSLSCRLPSLTSAFNLHLSSPCLPPSLPLSFPQLAPPFLALPPRLLRSPPEAAAATSSSGGGGWRLPRRLPRRMRVLPPAAPAAAPAATPSGGRTHAPHPTNHPHPCGQRVISHRVGSESEWPGRGVLPSPASNTEWLVGNSSYTVGQGVFPSLAALVFLSAGEYPPAAYTYVMRMSGLMGVGLSFRPGSTPQPYAVPVFSHAPGELSPGMRYGLTW